MSAGSAKTLTTPARGTALAGVDVLDHDHIRHIRTGMRVLLRVDWNVPIAAGQVLDLGRVLAAIPTLELLVRCGARVTVMTHLGYPGGRRTAGLETAVLAECVASYGPAVTLLENLRFSPGEERNDPAFAAELARDQDVFVNDAFSCMHRSHASIVGVPALLPSLLGPLARREIAAIDRWWQEPDGARGLIVGGSKIADKLPLLAALAPHAEVVAVAGRTALPFLVATGRAAAEVAVDRDELAVAATLLRLRDDILVPSDLVVRAGGSGRVLCRRTLRATDRYLDIGPASVRRFGRALRSCATVLWSGPLGRYEEPPFDQGTAGLLRSLGAARRVVIAGGGDTAAAIRRLGLAGDLGNLSTGGGAMLAYLATGDLVGLAALRS